MTQVLLQSRRRGWGWLLLLPSGFAAFLGTWQVNRRQSKHEMLAARSAAFEVRILSCGCLYLP